MDYTNVLTKYKAVEVNKLAGLLNGHIVAQTVMKAATPVVQNGLILFLTKDNELGLINATGASKFQPFLHYTEELLTFAYGNEYFAVTVEDGECYPRAIGLYEGDEFTTNNIPNLEDESAFTQWNEGEAWAIVDATSGALKLVNAYPTSSYEGPVFKAYKDTLPTGTLAARLVLLTKYIKLT